MSAELHDDGRQVTIAVNATAQRVVPSAFSGETQVPRWQQEPKKIESNYIGPLAWIKNMLVSVCFAERPLRDYVLFQLHLQVLGLK